MKKKDIYGDFYSPEKLMSYGRPYNITLGTRSIGKSTGHMIRVLLRFLNYGEHFVYMRRDKDELMSTAPSACNNAMRIINRYYNKDVIKSLEYRQNTYWVNEKVAGFAIPLSTQQKYKSIDYSNVYTIIYDECIPFNGRYLGGKDNPFAEVEAIESFIQTCDRSVDEAFSDRVKLVCIGNNRTYYNPLILSLGADKYLTTETKYLAPKDAAYVIEQTIGVEATKNYKESNVYKLASKTTREYAFEGGLDNDKFIGQPKGVQIPLCNLIYKGDTFGISFSKETGIVFVNSKPVKSDIKLALTAADHSINYMLINSWHDSYCMTYLRTAYNTGNILFANGKSKFMINQYFKYEIL